MPAITVKSLSKTYRLYSSKRDFIKEGFHPLRKKYHRKFHALKDISFTAEKGEVIGIIGKNGSGKSTLLKILASIVTPSSGNIQCNGRVTALLELGGGFNNELTGIQNVQFLGAVQGYSKKEMLNRLPAILEFAEIGEYAWQPVKSYSSGMYMRLAFSLAINIDPEILIVDEVLAVGDARFQQKCYRKIRDFQDQGKTIIICTHNMGVVKDFCTRAIWLDEGKIKEHSSPKKVTDHYNANMRAPESGQHKKENTNTKQEDNNFQIITDFRGSLYQKIRWNNLSNCESFGTNCSFIRQAAIINVDNFIDISMLQGGENVRILLRFEDNIHLEKLRLVLQLSNQLGSSVFIINSDAYNQPFSITGNKPTIVAIDFVFPAIGNGQYSISTGVFKANKKTEQTIHWVHDALILDVFNSGLKYKTGAPLVIEKATFHSVPRSNSRQ